MNVLFVTYGGGHVNMVIPVVEQLRARGIDTMVLGLTTAQAVLARRGIPHCTARQFFNPTQDRLESTLGEALADRWHSPEAGIPREESVAYLGFCMADLVRTNGEEGAHQLLARFGRQVFLPTTLIRRVLDWYQPDVVVTTNSPRSERAALKEAKARGIPTLRIEDLFAMEDPETYQPTFQEDLADPPFDYIAVLADATRRRLLQKGVASDRILLTGNPAFDTLAVPTGRNPSLIRGQLGIPPHKSVITWASQPVPWRFEAMSMLLEGLYAHQADVHLVYKLHPGEQLADYAQDLPAWVTLTREFGIRDLLDASAAVGTCYSTVGLEALLLHRPLFVLKREGWPFRNILEGVDSVTILDQPVQLASWVKEVLSNRDAIRTAEVNGVVSDGRAALRLADVIEAMGTGKPIVL